MMRKTICMESPAGTLYVSEENGKIVRISRIEETLYGDSEILENCRCQLNEYFAGKRKLTFYRNMKQFLFLCISGMAMGASWIFLYEAYTQIGVSISSLLYYCGPVLVMALSPILFRERLGVSKIIGFALVLCGIFFVNGNAFDGSGNSFGFFCGIMSAVMYAFMVICNKKAADITGLENSMLQLFISFLTVAVFVGLKQGFAIQITRQVSYRFLF